MSEHINNATKVAEFLLKINAVQLQPTNPFTWASGWKSPIYCDNRKVLGHPEIRNFIKKEFVSLINKSCSPSCIAGVATGGIGIGALVADALNLPFCYVRSATKSHGMKNNIEGDLKKNDKVYVIEDLISSGSSSLKAVQDLRDFGVEVLALGAIFTYGFQKSIDNFKKASCSFRTLSEYPTLIESAVQNNYISKSDLDTLNLWRKNPSIWKGNA